MLIWEPSTEQRYTSKRDMISRIPLGTQPDALWQELLASGHPSVWKAGDAIATGKINKAVLHGSKFGYSLN